MSGEHGTNPAEAAAAFEAAKKIIGPTEEISAAEEEGKMHLRWMKELERPKTKPAEVVKFPKKTLKKETF